MEPVCYHKCSKSLLPNRDVANDSDLEKIVGGRGFFGSVKKKRFDPQFPASFNRPIFSASEIVPRCEFKALRKFPFDTLHETNIARENG